MYMITIIQNRKCINKTRQTDKIWYIYENNDIMLLLQRDTTLRGRLGATDVRAKDVRALSKNRELLTLLEFSTIKSARWNGLYLRGNICFPKVCSGKSFHNFRRYDSRRLLRRMRIWYATFFFGGRAHTHTSEHREVKYAGQNFFGSWNHRFYQILVIIFTFFII